MAQKPQDVLRQGDVAVLGPLTAGDMDQHALRSRFPPRLTPSVRRQ
jgi:hypothetical protein